MTTIAARIQPNGKVKMAWDAQVTSGNTASRNFVKARSLNGQGAIGISGHLRFANLIHHASVSMIHPKDLYTDDADIEEWLVEDVIPVWQKAVHDSMRNSQPETDYPWGRVLIAISGRIFEIGADFAVNDEGDFAAVGSGSPFAMAAMHLGKSPAAAVGVASVLDLFTGGEIKEMTV